MACLLNLCEYTLVGVSNLGWKLEAPAQHPGTEIESFYRAIFFISLRSAQKPVLRIDLETSYSKRKAEA